MILLQRQQLPETFRPLILLSSLPRWLSTVKFFQFSHSALPKLDKWHLRFEHTPWQSNVTKHLKCIVLYFLRQLKKFNLPQAHMTQFYSAVIESVLCSSITVWFGSASKSDIRRLQRTVRTAERIIGVHLPSLQDLFYSRVKKRAGNIITDPSHPGHDLFALLPSGRRYRSLCTRTSRHKNSFFPHAISSLNN